MLRNLPAIFLHWHQLKAPKTPYRDKATPALRSTVDLNQ